jgi:hypothetical protein
MRERVQNVEAPCLFLQVMGLSEEVLSLKASAREERKGREREREEGRERERGLELMASKLQGERDEALLSVDESR